MNYKTHVNGGMLLGLVTCSQLPLPIPAKLTFLTGTLIGSILPDIDHKNSYLGNKLKPLSATVNLVAGHRKLFHSGILYAAIYLIGKNSIYNPYILQLLFGLFIGAISHLILDTFNPLGIPWFYPLSKKKLSIASIKTGGKLETIFCLLLLAGNIYMTYSLVKGIF